MDDKTDTAAEAAAEKAYAAATEAQPVKAAPAVQTPAAQTVVSDTPAAAEPEVEFPSKAKRSPTAKAAAAPAPIAKPAKAADPAPAQAIAPKAKLKASTVRRAAKVSPKKLKKARPAGQTASKPQTVSKPAKVLPKAKPTVSINGAASTAAAPKSLIQQLKEKTMDTNEFTTKIKGAVTEAQAKAKEALNKGAATFGEYNEFTKGNAEAVVASGKILATGMQTLGKTFIEDGKAAIETLTAEAKELAAVKSPADFFKLQAEFLRRNFDIAVSNTSKNSEAVLKLASEAAAPISARVNLAVEKVKQAA